MSIFTSEAKAILSARYLLKDENGTPIETPNQMLDRVATFIASAEKNESLQTEWKNKFLKILKSLEFLPNSPTLMNAGKRNAQLSACFVLPVEDDLSAIFECVKNVALIHKTGGGTGVSFNRIRPNGSMVNSTKGTASGVISFMSVFNQATEVIKQGGVRRGANMGMLSISHPEIYDFINCKSDFKSFQNFNLSIAVTDNFLKAAIEGTKFPLKDPYRKTKKYINATDLFTKICEQAWLTGDPGLVFITTINDTNRIPWAGKIECTNPCGEQPLLPYESCNLGSINLDKFVSSNGSVRWNKLGRVVETAVRFLDNVIEKNTFPRSKIHNKTHHTRKIGLGVMGWADMLLSMGLKYGSKESLELARNISSFIQSKAEIASKQLGREKGFAPVYSGTKNTRIKKRNSTLTTIAPTGTLSILAGCSSGIEPIFAKKFSKTVMNGTQLDLGKKYKDIHNEPYFVTTRELSYEDHLNMQAAFQENVDNAVSKTINLPKTATVEDVKNAFLLAWMLKCKGITVFRENCREDTPIVYHSTEDGTDEMQLSECENGRCGIL